MKDLALKDEAGLSISNLGYGADKQKLIEASNGGSVGSYISTSKTE